VETEELDPSQSAQPHECGSCQFFARNEPNSFVGSAHTGECRFKFPDHIERASGDARFRLDPEGNNMRRQRETDGCSLWQPKTREGRPVQFVQKRYWHAGEPGR
jgi:hypothetical protein